MPTFKSLKDAHVHIQTKINEALADEVFKTVRAVELGAIQEEVYAVYTPEVYIRRRSHGGLADPLNIQKREEPKDGTLVVVNVTKPNTDRRSYRVKDRKWKSILRNAAKKDLPEQVEYGDDNPWQYDFQTDEAYMSPRPFTDATIRKLDATGNHIAALKKGLQKRGIKVVS